MIAQYIEYFKTIAVTHPLLLHKDEEGEKAFFAIDFMELLGSFRNGIRPQGVAFYLLNYQSRYSQLGIEAAEGGFVVMSYFDKSLQGSKQAVYDLTETVVNQTIARLQHDSNLLHPLWLDSLQHLDSFEKVAYQYASNNDYIGWLVTFKWQKVHNMSQYIADYLPPAVTQTPISFEGWVYLINGLAVYKWTTPRTHITINAADVMAQYRTIKVQDILNEWSNSLRNLSDTFWEINGYLLTLRFTETQQGTVWIAGTADSDRFTYNYAVGQLAISDDAENVVIDELGNVITYANPDGYFLIDFSEEITVEGDDIEIRIYNAVGVEISQLEFEFKTDPSNKVHVYLNDHSGQNATGTIFIRVIP